MAVAVLVRRDETGRDGTGWDGMGRDGTERNGAGRRGTERDVEGEPVVKPRGMFWIPCENVVSCT